MGSSKALLALVLFMATIILISSEVAPKDIDDNLDSNDGKFDTNGIGESKYPRGFHGGRWRGGPGRGGGYHGGYHCPYGCCRWSYYGGCRRCCYYPGERVEANLDDVQPYN